MKKTILLLVFLAASVMAFSPPPVDDARASLCGKTGGAVNITLFEPQAGGDGPEGSLMPVEVFRCDCGGSFVWNETVGCRAPSYPTPSLLSRIIAFIRRLLGGLL